MGSQPRDRLFAGEAAQRGLSRGQAGNFPVVLIDGVVGGLWHQRRSGRRVEITAELFRPLRTPQKDELMAQADRIGGFLRADASLAIGPIRARAHA
ncbi:MULTISPECIES: DNA glycosylase AlkZ-like family protein [Bacteria]|uniref:DNA glycosylase AlkZ-like family protein n=1 Tax=Bacteria TaxID=2 RepID=UPI001C8F2187